MKINWHDYPFRHYIVENFLSEEDFAAVRQYHFDEVPAPKVGRNNKRNENISKEMRDILYPPMLELAKQVNPKGENHPLLNKLRLNIEFDAIQPGYGHAIHTDIKGKWVVFVLHVGDSGYGTRLHETGDGPIVKTMPWIPNGGGGFIRSDSSWHSFDTHETDTVRRTVILNLMI